MENNNSFLFENRLKWLYLIGFFLILALPLLNLPPWFSPPDWGKTIVFRIVLSILIFIFIWQILFRKDFFSIVQRRIPRGSAALAFWLLITLLGVFFLATLLSQEPYFSFWGSPHRSGGFLNFAFCIAFALLSFFILKDKDWKKIWDFSIVIGILVSLIGIFQLYGLFGNVLISFSGRPPSTIGGPIFLAIYLLLLSFLTLSFGIKEKRWLKRIFYFSSLLLFLFTALIVTQTRAAFVGLFIGFLYFFLFYPTPKIKLEENSSSPNWRRTVLLQTLIKIVIGVILISGVYGVYYVNTAPELPQFIQENKLLKLAISRLSIERALEDPRISGWKVGWQALKNKPIIGYGPENFSIGFDKYYDPSLPGISTPFSGAILGWWDRAHNILLDTGTSAGILGLIIYFPLFGVLLWLLQKLKKKKPENLIIYHSIQATFLGYLAANFFSFDTFSTYLISFLLIGYSLHLIYNTDTEKEQRPALCQFWQRAGLSRIFKYKKAIIVILFLFLIWFIWCFNIKPLRINTEANWAKHYSQKQNWSEAFSHMEIAYNNKHSFIDNSIGLNYIDIINTYLKENPTIDQVVPLSNKAVEILRKDVQIRPTYTRSWLLLGTYLNIILEKQELSPEEFEKLKNETNFAFEKAEQLSPKRQEILINWTRTDLITKNFQAGKEKAQKCIEINPEFRDCYWIMTLTSIYLNEIEQAEKNIDVLNQKKYPINTEMSLLQLSNAYIYIKNYSELADIYQKLVKIKPKEIQYRASLATVYREIGNYKKAKEEALKILEIEPKMKPSVDEFLKTLPI